MRCDRSNAGGHFGDLERNRLVGIGADLEAVVAAAAVEQLVAVELGGAGDSVDFRCQLVDFVLDGGAVTAAVGAVGRLHRQVAHALQDVADLAHRPFGRLRQRDGVVGVAAGLIQAADLRSHAGCNRQTGGIVLGAVDAQAGRQPLQQGGQRRLRLGQVVLCVKGGEVGVDH